MEITLNVQTLITIGSVLTALGVIWKALSKISKFISRQEKQDDEIAAIRSEQTLICYGVLACLKGLKEQGCNGTVTGALDETKI